MKPLSSHSGSAGSLHGPPTQFFFLYEVLHWIMVATLSWLDPKQSSNIKSSIKNAKTLWITKNHAEAVPVVTVAVVDHVSWFAGYFGPAFPVLIPQEAKWGDWRMEGRMDGWAGHFWWVMSWCNTTAQRGVNTPNVCTRCLRVVPALLCLFILFYINI